MAAVLAAPYRLVSCPERDGWYCVVDAAGLVVGHYSARAVRRLNALR